MNILNLTEEEKCLIENHILRGEHIYVLGSKKCQYCGFQPENKNGGIPKMATKTTYKLKEKYKNGYLDEVVNPCGKKPSVYIYQGIKPGFSAKYVKSGRAIPGSSRDAEAYAKKLAKAGHKKVIFRD